MGQIRKIDDTYYIEFFARGLMYSQIAGHNLAAAQKLLIEIEKKIAQGESLTIVRNINLPAFFDQFIQEINPQYSQISTQRFNALIAHFNIFLHSHNPLLKELSQITPSVVESYKAHLIQEAKKNKKFNPKKVNFSILLLREILEYGIKIGFLNDNPSLHIQLLEMPGKEHPSPRCQTAKELFAKKISLGKISQLLKINDIAKVMYYSKLIPLKREDMYN